MGDLGGVRLQLLADGVGPPDEDTGVPEELAGVDEDAGQLGIRLLGDSTLEAMMRFYDTPFYAKLEDESTKLWTYSPQQLYYLFRNAA